jgi:hypothetical protein
MFMTWLRSMLGPFTIVLDYFSAHPGTLTLILGTWASVYFAGLMQLKYIESKTTSLVLENSRHMLTKDPNLTPTDLYKQIYPIWVAEMKNWRVLFIPHENDLWPVSVTKEHILTKLHFSPDWISKTLEKDGITVN